jgi:hypothetical protein
MGISLSGIFLLPTQPSPAQTSSVPPPSAAPLDLALLNKGASRNDGVITDDTISQRGLTIPSLWWAKQQFADKLLDNWLAYPGGGTKPGRIDLVVNQQNWSLLDYLERYAFVNQFGTVARDYGYNVRVFDAQAKRLATYTCNFNTTPRLCSVYLDATSNPLVPGSAP